MTRLTTPHAVDRFVAGSDDSPVLLFIHSSSCPVSAAALTVVKALERKLDLPVGMVVVQDEPMVSRYVEKQTGITHESPQLLLLHGRHVVADWHHRAIDEDAVFAAVLRLPSRG